ncbi:hypothetical protein KKG24_04595, partial [Patescibacteria group bacterium]|nr:hypothetical protein [Patescibacteria group bacterium]
SHECEVDTELTVKCSTCRLEFDVDLPFGRSFLDPSSLSRREKRFGNDDASFDDRQGHQASAVTIQTSALPSSGELIGKLKRVLQPKPPMTGAG